MISATIIAAHMKERSHRPTLSMDFRPAELTRRHFLSGIIGFTAMATAPRVQGAFLAIEINHVTLNVGDLKKSEEFFSKLFGPPTGIKLGSSELALQADRTRRIGFDHFCLSVKGYDLLSTATKLKQYGVDPQYPYGPRQLCFSDSDGIIVQLTAIDHAQAM
jgi:hypothetical protein